MVVVVLFNLSGNIELNCKQSYKDACQEKRIMHESHFFCLRLTPEYGYEAT